MLIPLKTIDQVMLGVRQPPPPFLIAIVFAIGVDLEVGVAVDYGAGWVRQRRAANAIPTMQKWRDGLAAYDLVVADMLAAAGTAEEKSRPVVLRVNCRRAFLEEIRRLVTVEKP